MSSKGTVNVHDKDLLLCIDKTTFYAISITRTR